MDHDFGGVWTRKKLEILEKYLRFYCIALQNMPFNLHYADAFAGSGFQLRKRDEQQYDLLPEEELLGSVRRALAVEPGFDAYHFNDIDDDVVKYLNSLQTEFPQKSINVSAGDANEFVPSFCQKLRKGDRAVLFLDRFSTQLDWSTLDRVAQTRNIDLWLLFPISVIFRMTPKDGARIRPEWSNTLNRLLGTSDWESALYEPQSKPQVQDLFGMGEPDELSERVNLVELENYVTQRLESIFQYVAKPIQLLNNNRLLFLFYFAVSNDSPKAHRLADKVVKQIT